MNEFVKHLVEIYYKTEADDTDEEIRSVLDKAGVPFQLSVVENYADFEEKASGTNPEIIMIDAALPKEQILEAIHTAAKKSAKASVFIIVKTLAQVAEAMSLEGITGFLIKGRITQLIPFLAKIATERAEKIRAEEERDTLARYLETANAVFVVFDEEGKVSHINKYACDLIGMNCSEILGKEWVEEFIPEDEKSKVINVLEQLKKPNIQPVKYYINDIITKQGSRKTIAWSNSITFHSNGRLKEIISFGTDITDKRKYEVAMDAYTRFNVRETGDEYFKALVVYLTRTLHVDVAFISKFEGDFLDECRTIAVAEDSSILPNFNYRATENSAGSGNEIRFSTATDGKTDKFLNSELVERFNAKEFVGVVLIGSAGQKLGELGLLCKNPFDNRRLLKLILQLFSIRAGTELEHIIHTSEINTLNGLLRERAKELLRATDDLQQLSHVISHDFNEPLRAITMLTGIFKEKYDTGSDKEINKYIQQVQLSTERTREMLNKILEYSRVNTRGNSFEVTQFDFIVHKAKQRLISQLTSAGGVISNIALPATVADEEQMIIVFSHLIDNSIKFRHYGRQLIINIYAEKDERNWTFYIEDNGVGFKNSYADKIFRMFTRLNNNPQNTGTGLGLTICRKIIERHGGKIGAVSEPGIGTKIHFSLPI